MHIHRKRSPLGNLGITLLPDQIAIPSAFQAFGPEGHLVDPKQEAKVKALGATLVENLKYAWDLWRKAVLLLACSSSLQRHSRRLALSKLPTRRIHGSLSEMAYFWILTYFFAVRKIYSSMTTETITFTTKGQVVIPAPIRRMFGIEEGTKGAVTVTEDGILIRPITKAYISGLRGSLKHLPLMEVLTEDRVRERDL